MSGSQYIPDVLDKMSGSQSAKMSGSQSAKMSGSQSAKMSGSQSANEVAPEVDTILILKDYQGNHCVLYVVLSSIYLYCGLGEPPENPDGHIYMKLDESDERIYIPKFDKEERFLGFKNSGGVSLSSTLEGIISKSTPQYAEEYISNDRELSSIKLRNGTLTISCSPSKIVNVHSGIIPPILMEVIANLINKKNGDKYDETTLDCSRIDFEKYYKQWRLRTRVC